jgi:ATP-dependent exoDNAse (exonuclease V) beta subunit
MMTKPFIIYKSSAGSGKTYTLTMEYLRLALKHPQAFNQILAVTFTNKATQEMKERILKELKRLRNHVDPSQKMDSELLRSLEIQEDELRMRASQTLTAILHGYNKFAVSTIDSFFQKVVRAFAREMDLNAKFEIELDQEGVLDRVVDRVIMKVMDDSNLHRWLVDFAHEQIQNGKSWDIRSNIKGLGKQIFQEEFKKYGSEIREFLQNDEGVRQLMEYVRKNRKLLLDKSLLLKREAEAIRESLGLEWTDFKNSSRGFGPKFGKLGSLPNPIPELSDIQANSHLCEEDWYTKNSPKRDAICSAYRKGLGDILGQFRPLLLEWETNRAIAHNIFVYGVFRHLLEELRAIKDEENMLLISDANEFLKEITKENDAPFIYEKVGNQFRNYLIDEFQDTSGFQWASFKPLLENSLAQGNTNLLVGDVKQSIYRWRGGEMKLLLDQVEEEIGSHAVENKYLDTNFRSLPNIIKFNNTLFRVLPKVFEDSLRTKYGATDSGILTKAYMDVHQEVSQRKASGLFKGKVKIDFFEKKQVLENEEGEGETVSRNDQVLEKLPSMVKELQDRGYEARDIAFLVRKKSDGEQIADALLAFAQQEKDPSYCFDVLSDESMFLHKASSVNALLAAMSYLHDPEDQVQFKSIWYYRAFIFGEPIDHELFALDLIPEYLKEKVQSFQQQVSVLLQLPLMELFEELVHLLDLDKQDGEKAYLSGFKEAVYEFSAKNRADLGGFLAWWEDNREKRTVKIPDSHNAMRILTIHKSKGLQFKVVIMPFLSWRIFDVTKGNVLWTPFSDGAAQLSAILPMSLSGLDKTHFKSIYQEEATMAFLDNLNLLYVAMTRAEEVIWGCSSVSKSVNEVETNLLQSLMLMAGDSQDGLGAFDTENSSFTYGEWPQKKHFEAHTTLIKPMRWAYQNWSSLLQIKSYANDFSAAGLEQRKKRNFGVLVHELLEKSRSKSDIRRYLEKFRFEGRLDKEDIDEISRQLNTLFADEQFSAWFKEGEIILAEQGILLPGGTKKRPDRIIIRADHAIVVDFKTGERNQKYAEQVVEYMQLVSGITQKEVKGYLCYLESGSIEEVYA